MICYYVCVCLIGFLTFFVWRLGCGFFMRVLQSVLRVRVMNIQVALICVVIKMGSYEKDQIKPLTEIKNEIWTVFIHAMEIELMNARTSRRWNIRKIMRDYKVQAVINLPQFGLLFELTFYSIHKINATLNPLCCVKVFYVNISESRSLWFT